MATGIPIRLPKALWAPRLASPVAVQDHLTAHLQVLLPPGLVSRTRGISLCVIISEHQLFNVTAVEKAQRHGVERLKEICLRNTIRRTGQSATPDGKTITGSLPPSTFIHVVFEPSQAEVDASRALEETNVTEGRLETARRVDAFYNEARKYLSFPPGIRTNSRAMTVDARPAGQPLSKLTPCIL
ncbi:hypothetical protein B0H16DRAFT_1796003 [Mycena metata]|uniref:Uncharacterized protein n=1 Tax=Mycena metata TaxID=1033252 RepID=A0AAD7MIF9_9AGAR|nr:hypothetical protein B0H16DRAFT_1796003 [Mycena metata]